MSEHTLIKGTCEYLHIPYREDNGFTYCKRCKKFVNKIEIQFNEGWASDWMQVNCGHCHKAIWTCEFANEDVEGTYKREFIKDDKICFICKKPTNKYDCYCTTYSSEYPKGVDLCSRKCNQEFNKQIYKKWKKEKKKKQ